MYIFFHSIFTLLNITWKVDLFIKNEQELYKVFLPEYMEGILIFATQNLFSKHILYVLAYSKFWPFTPHWYFYSSLSAWPKRDHTCLYWKSSQEPQSHHHQTIHCAQSLLQIAYEVTIRCRWFRFWRSVLSLKQPVPQPRCLLLTHSQICLHLVPLSQLEMARCFAPHKARTGSISSLSFRWSMSL